MMLPNHKAYIIPDFKLAYIIPDFKLYEIIHKLPRSLRFPVNYVFDYSSPIPVHKSIKLITHELFGIVLKAMLHFKAI